jgi:hypothetical protein
MTIGLGAVFVASFGSLFLTPTTSMKSGLSIPLPGWLVLYSGYLLYKTQLIIYNAEHYPQRAKFDPIGT